MPFRLQSSSTRSLTRPICVSGTQSVSSSIHFPSLPPYTAVVERYPAHCRCDICCSECECKVNTGSAPEVGGMVEST